MNESPYHYQPYSPYPCNHLKRQRHAQCLLHFCNTCSTFPNYNIVLKFTYKTNLKAPSLTQKMPKNNLRVLLVHNNPLLKILCNNFQRHRSLFNFFICALTKHAWCSVRLTGSVPRSEGFAFLTCTPIRGMYLLTCTQNQKGHQRYCLNKHLMHKAIC